MGILRTPPVARDVASSSLHTAIAACLVSLALASPAAAGPPQLDVETIELFRFVERIDGTVLPPGSLPYEFEACVVGTNITSASVTLPGAGSPTALVQDPQSPTEWCIGQGFTSNLDLVNAFPNGDYLFTINGGGIQDTETVTMSASEPGAYTDYFALGEGSIIPEAADLDVSWTLTEKPNGLGCLTPMPSDCADAIAYSIFNLTTQMDLGFARIGIGDTSILGPISSAGYTAGDQLEVEVETFNGEINALAQTDMGDEFLLLSIYEDINSILLNVPEPGSGSLAAVSLTVLLGLRRRAPKR